MMKKKAGKTVIWKGMALPNIITSFFLLSQGFSQQYTGAGMEPINAVSVRNADSALVRYEKEMMENNPAIEAAYAGWQAERHRVAVSRGLPDPRIQFGYFLESVETAVGPQRFRIGVSQMVPWPGKLIVQGEIQKMKAEAEYQLYRNVVNQILFQLRSAYYEYYYLVHATDITRQNLSLVRSWEKVITQKYKADLAAHADLIKTQIESLRLEEEVRTLEAKRLPLFRKFQALLNRAQLDSIAVPDSLTLRPLTLSRQELMEAVFSTSPMIKRSASLADAGRLGFRRARLEYAPDLSFGLDYIDTGNKTAQGRPVFQSGKDPVMVMASVNIPLWWTRQRDQIRSAEMESRESGYRLEEMEQNLRVEVERVWVEMETALRQLDLYQNSLIPKSHESIQASGKAYAAGQSGLLSLIDAQRRLLQFQLARERALVDYNISIALLESLAGRSL